MYLCRAGELGVPVGHMTFKGLLNHINDITTLCEDFPDTKVIIDHFGFCSAKQPDGQDWQALYGLSRFPQVYVKVRPTQMHILRGCKELLRLLESRIEAAVGADTRPVVVRDDKSHIPKPACATHVLHAPRQ